MAETRPITYRTLWQSWWHVPLVLTVGIAATVHAIILYVSGLDCPGCAYTTGEAISATLTISLGIGILGLPLPHLLSIVTTLQERKVGFRSLTEKMDTTTP